MIKIEYGEEFIDWESSLAIDAIGMQDAPEPVPIPRAMEDALAKPIASDALRSIAKSKLNQHSNAQAIIVISDNTRPVPYYGEQGLVFQIVRTLSLAGFSDQQITILIGAGSHRNMDAQEIERMIGLRASGLDQIRVVNHEYDNREHLVPLGTTKRGSQVWINKMYHEADLKIVTGLVESHFMAGASGGRKGICPAIVGKETLTIFHGATFLSSLQAADLVLSGNPLHEEATEIAAMAGCDFLVNVTLDGDKAVTGVFAGDLVAAHQAAVAKIKSYVTVPLDQLYDIVVIPAGFVGINHYQAAKAAVEAARALKPGGKIIIIAKNTDLDPIGGEGYKQTLRLLHAQGKQSFMQMISDPSWQIIQEQWQVQMWCKVLDVTQSEDHLYYCALEIPEEEYEYLPGHPAIQFLTDGERNLPAAEAVILMLNRSLRHAMKSCEVAEPTILFLKDGPYGIPTLDKGHDQDMPELNESMV